jgi:hypothetical protein
MIGNGHGRSIVLRACAGPPKPATECAQHLSPDSAAWRPADGILFSVVSSLVLWSALLTSVYTALD